MNKVLFVYLLVLCAVCGLVAGDASMWKDKEAVVLKMDFYEMLGVSRDTDLKGLKKAFRLASIRNHPDKSVDDNDKAFRELIYPRYVLANDVLTNEKKRRNYDHLLEIGKRPERITDNDIDTAWDEERGMWTSDYNWAPLEEWHSLLLIIGITIAGFAIPIYNQKKNEKEKKAKAERVRNENLRHLQVVASKGKEVFLNDSTLQKKMSEGLEAASKTVEKKVKKAKTEQVVEQVDKAKNDKEEKARVRHEKLRTTAALLLNALSQAKSAQNDAQLQRIKNEIANYGEIVPASVKQSVGLFSTEFSTDETNHLLTKLPADKLENMVNSLCGTVGKTLNQTIEQACAGARPELFVQAFDDVKLRNSLTTVYRLLAELKYKQFPAIMAVTK